MRIRTKLLILAGVLALGIGIFAAGFLIWQKGDQEPEEEQVQTMEEQEQQVIDKQVVRVEELSFSRISRAISAP